MGCKSNQFEGQIVAQKLAEADYQEVKKLQDAEIFILNSCSVTHKSDDEAMYHLRHAKNLGLKTILTGCVAQIEKENLLKLVIDLCKERCKKANKVEVNSIIINSIFILIMLVFIAFTLFT